MCIKSDVRCCCLVAKSCPAHLGPHALQPTRLLGPQDSPGKYPGEGLPHWEAAFPNTCVFSRNSWHPVTGPCIDSKADPLVCTQDRAEDPGQLQSSLQNHRLIPPASQSTFSFCPIMLSQSLTGINSNKQTLKSASCMQISEPQKLFLRKSSQQHYSVPTIVPEGEC